jgi:hypothetical protein
MNGGGKRDCHPWQIAQCRHLGSKRLGGTQENSLWIAIPPIPIALIKTRATTRLNFVPVCVPASSFPARVLFKRRLRFAHVLSVAPRFSQACNSYPQAPPRLLFASWPYSIYVFSVQLYPGCSTRTQRCAHHVEPAQRLERVILPSVC